jgi:hypothetical protein
VIARDLDQKENDASEDTHESLAVQEQLWMIISAIKEHACSSHEHVKSVASS